MTDKIKRKSRKRFIVAILLIFCALLRVEAGNLDFSLTREDSTYIVYYSFPTTCPKDTLLQIFHNYGHITRYLTQPNLSTTLIDSTDIWNKIIYRYRYVISTFSLTLSRDLLADEGRVVFKLIESINDTWLIPKVLFVNGYYHVKEQGDTNIVSFYQRTTLDQEIRWFQFQIIRAETNSFLKGLTGYIWKIYDTFN